MRPVLAIALLGLSSAACSSGPALNGLLNNERHYERAYSVHLEAWDKQVGPSPSARKVEIVFRERGGGCTWTTRDQFVCVVDVEPRYLSLTQRIIWSMSFAQEGADRVRLLDTRLDHLGCDL
jgi:hypothetical protein